MNEQSPKIAFYVRRSFGDKLNASFDFIKENWKAILKYTIYLILPVCLLQAMSLSSFMDTYMKYSLAGDYESLGLAFFTPEFGISYMITILLSLLGGLLMTSLVYSLIKTYNEREDRLKGVTLGDLKNLLTRNMGRIFLMGLVMFALIIVLILIMTMFSALTPYTLIITMPAFFVIIVAMALCIPVYLFEEIRLGDALVKGFRLGIATWGGIFGIGLLMAIIGGILQGVLGTPFSVAVFVKSLFFQSELNAQAGSSIGYSFFTYILGIIYTFGIYISAVFGIVGISYQYSHASEKMDSITVESEIDKFEQL